jgi:hypothetical protein
VKTSTEKSQVLEVHGGRKLRLLWADVFEDELDAGHARGSVSSQTGRRNGRPGAMVEQSSGSVSADGRCVRSGLMC